MEGANGVVVDDDWGAADYAAAAAAAAAASADDVLPCLDLGSLRLTELEDAASSAKSSCARRRLLPFPGEPQQWATAHSLLCSSQGMIAPILAPVATLPQLPGHTLGLPFL